MPIKLKAKDYYLAALAGFGTGLFVIPVLMNSGSHSKAVFVALPVFLAIAWAIGLWLGKFLGEHLYTVIFQLAKFAEVGFLNTAIGFGVLNIISLATGITAGVGAGGINIPGTILAAGNSYLWNKFWVFPQKDNKGYGDIVKFAFVTLVAIIVNGAIIAAFTHYISPMFGLNKGAWLNVGKVVATALSFMINFLGYKFFVFVKKSVR